jgi:hypothetical protein
MKIKAELSTGFVGAKHTTIIDFDDEELEDLTKEEKEKHIDEIVQEWANEHIEIYWNEVEE